jgi:hypothetical protein
MKKIIGLTLMAAMMVLITSCTVVPSVRERYEQYVALAEKALSNANYQASRGYWESAFLLTSDSHKRAMILDYIGFTHFFEGDLDSAMGRFVESRAYGATYRNSVGCLHVAYWSREYESAYLHGLQAMANPGEFSLMVGGEQMDHTSSQTLFAFTLAVLMLEQEFEALAPSLEQQLVDLIRGVFFP